MLWGELQINTTVTFGGGPGGTTACDTSSCTSFLVYNAPSQGLIAVCQGVASSSYPLSLTYYHGDGELLNNNYHFNYPNQLQNVQPFADGSGNLYAVFSDQSGGTIVQSFDGLGNNSASAAVPGSPAVKLLTSQDCGGKTAVVHAEGRFYGFAVTRQDGKTVTALNLSWSTPRGESLEVSAAHSTDSGLEFSNALFAVNTNNDTVVKLTGCSMEWGTTKVGSLLVGLAISNPESIFALQAKPTGETLSSISD